MYQAWFWEHRIQNEISLEWLCSLSSLWALKLWKLVTLCTSFFFFYLSLLASHSLFSSVKEQKRNWQSWFFLPNSLLFCILVFVLYFFYTWDRDVTCHSTNYGPSRNAEQIHHLEFAVQWNYQLLNIQRSKEIYELHYGLYFSWQQTTRAHSWKINEIPSLIPFPHKTTLSINICTHFERVNYFLFYDFSCLQFSPSRREDEKTSVYPFKVVLISFSLTGRPRMPVICSADILLSLRDQTLQLYWVNFVYSYVWHWFHTLGDEWDRNLHWSPRQESINVGSVLRVLLP